MFDLLACLFVITLLLFLCRCTPFGICMCRCTPFSIYMFDLIIRHAATVCVVKNVFPYFYVRIKLLLTAKKIFMNIRSHILNGRAQN